MSNRTLFPILVDDKTGYIDELGHIVISPQYKYGSAFREGVAIISHKSEDFCIDTSGIRLFSHRGLGPHSWFSEGLCCVCNELGDKYGYVNKDGDVVIPYQFDDAGRFHNGLAGVEVGGKNGFINPQGEYVIEPLYSVCRYFERGGDHVPFRQNGVWGILAKDGRVTCPPTFEAMGIFAEGLVGARVNGVWGFVNAEGAWVIEPSFDDAQYGFSEGIAGVCRGEWWGGVNRNGEIVMDFKYSDLKPFSEGLATFRVGGDWSAVEYVRGGKCGVMDKTGKHVLQAFYDDIEAFYDGLAEIQVGEVDEGVGDRGYIDRRGAVIWQPSH